jgi:Ca2+-dependent lipid-binding protein
MTPHIPGNTRMKTSVIWGNNSPVWENGSVGCSFFGIRERLHKLRLNVKAFDKERIRRKRLLGSVTIGLATLNLHQIDSWFALDGGDSQSSELYVQIKVSDRLK